jgi:hypothetical protein
MNRIIPALAAALFASAAFGQAPAPTDVPAHKCEPKPEYPGRLGMQSDIPPQGLRARREELPGVHEQVPRGAQGDDEANEDAPTPHDEYNALMKKYHERRQAASKAAE